MADEDDELEDKQKPKPASRQIGGMAPPDVGPAQPPASLGMGVGGPINPPAPRPAGDRAAAMAASGPPQYHRFNRFLDTIAGATKIGSAIEEAGGLGTQGYRAKLGNAQEAANVEQGQIAEGEKERAANAQVENVGAEAQQHQATAGREQAQAGAITSGAQDVATYDPVTGQTITVQKKDVPRVVAPEITQEGGLQRNQQTVTGRHEDVAATNTSHEGIAAGQQQTQRDVANTRGQYGVESAQTRANAAGSKPSTFYAPDPNDPSVIRRYDVLPGGQVPQGAETSAGVNAGNAPTAQTRNMSQMAGTVVQQIPRIKQEIGRLAQQIGPLAGRWNQVYANKVGANDPEFTGLDTDLDLLSSAIVRTHFGARGGLPYQQALKKMFGEAQSPEDLISRIDHADEWLVGYAQAGRPGAGAPAAGGGASNDPLGIR